MIKKQIDGKTYHLPGSLTQWQEEMYVHLINWKRENITEEVGYNNYKGTQIPYDALFPEHIKTSCLTFMAKSERLLRSIRESFFLNFISISFILPARRLPVLTSSYLFW